MRKSCIIFIMLMITGTAEAQSGCDSTIEKHVFNPHRFKILNECITVKGIVKWLVPGADGDMHIALKPDSGYTFRLNAANLLIWDSCLVCEIVCQHEPNPAAGVGDICKGYLNNIQVPPPGAHILVTGKFVEDDGEGIFGRYGWNEIHPVSKINRLAAPPSGR